ncbi:Dual specificity protein phosphatase 15 [Leucoagaricus sp. SymC.cos]|nr:Dual specificity protein phosphatase 15 [Leucoagaricus sp. SymC.cos]
MLSFPQQKWQVVRTSTLRTTHGEDVNLITDRVYLGNWTAAGDRDQLTKLGITHVVSILEIPPDIPDVIEKKNQLHIQINDTANSDILRHLEQTTKFIESAIRADDSNKVLVHCLMGISRSATVVSAYLIATQKMTGADAIAYVQKKRPIVCPNLGFRQQLDIFADQGMDKLDEVEERILEGTWFDDV